MSEEERLAMILEAVNYARRVSKMGMPASCFSKALREPVFFLWEKHGRSKEGSAKYRSQSSVGHTFGKREVVYDHAVPFRYVQEALLNLDVVDSQAVRNVLARWVVAAIITRDEDRALSAAGLGRRMPDGWDGENPLARYEQVGIEIVQNPLHVP